MNTRVCTRTLLSALIICIFFNIHPNKEWAKEHLKKNLLHTIELSKIASAKKNSINKELQKLLLHKRQLGALQLPAEELKKALQNHESYLKTCKNDTLFECATAQIETAKKNFLYAMSDLHDMTDLLEAVRKNPYADTRRLEFLYVCHPVKKLS